jgi:hypothetical protein
MADYLGFKVQRLKANQCRLFMPNVEAHDIIIDIEFTDNIANIEVSLRDMVEEVVDQRFKRQTRKN